MYRGLRLNIALAALTGLLASTAFAANVDVPRIIDASTTWTADNTYFLDGYTFVVTPAGAASTTVLTIEKGTVIMGRESASGAEASALVVTRTAEIDAQGTASQPIIFTSELDDLAGNLGPDDTQLWGGLVVLGNATINSRADNAVVAAPIVDQIEGFAVTASEEDYITFGGTDDDDSSGTIRYVSIRHGGAVLGTANEINGLSLGGVGRGTTIEYVEVFANKDDGVEFFGGTVDLKYFVSAFGKDDGVDYDQGYRGRIQFVCIIGGDSTVEAMDKGGEWDGATAPLDATPAGDPVGVYNATFIGNGPGGIANTAINTRDNASAKAYNSIFVDYAKMLLVENDASFVGGANAVANTARIDFENNVWWSHIGANNTAAGLNAGGASDLNKAFTEAFFSTALFNNTIADPMLGGISRTTDSGLDPRPMAGSPALTGPFATVPADDFYVQTSYKGAFAPSGPTWLQGWTKLSKDGYLTKVDSNTELANISTRCLVGTGDSIAIPGFVILGTGPKTVLIRAIGTDGLNVLGGVAGSLDDPSVELKAQIDGSTVGTNDNWGDAPNAGEIRAAAAAVYAFGVPEGSRDAMMLVTLNPGAYTVLTRGVGDTTGVVLVEVYAVD